MIAQPLILVKLPRDRSGINSGKWLMLSCGKLTKSKSIWPSSCIVFFHFLASIFSKAVFSVILFSKLIHENLILVIQKHLDSNLQRHNEKSNHPQ